MEIQHVQQLTYQPQFCAKPPKITHSGVTESACQKIRSPFDNALKIYDNLWEELALPNELKVPVKPCSYNDKTRMSFKFLNLFIGINKNLRNLKLRIMNITGITKALFRHEIEHIMQWWLIIRYCGSDNIIKGLTKDSKKQIENFDEFKKYLKKVEQHFGKIKPEEVEQAIRCIDGYNNLVSPNQSTNLSDTSMLFIIVRNIKSYIKYRHNPMERDAYKAQKEYMPSKLKFIKSAAKEIWNILVNKQSNEIK